MLKVRDNVHGVTLGFEIHTLERLTDYEAGEEERPAQPQLCEAVYDSLPWEPNLRLQGRYTFAKTVAVVLLLKHCYELLAFCALRVDPSKVSLCPKLISSGQSGNQ